MCEKHGIHLYQKHRFFLFLGLETSESHETCSFWRWTRRSFQICSISYLNIRTHGFNGDWKTQTWTGKLKNSYFRVYKDTMWRNSSSGIQRHYCAPSRMVTLWKKEVGVLGWGGQTCPSRNQDWMIFKTFDLCVRLLFIIVQCWKKYT